MKRTEASFTIRPAKKSDVAAIHTFISRLADYERLSNEMKATRALLNKHLFGPRPAAEVLIASIGRDPVGFALFFTTYSTFEGKPGIWLEDLFVFPEHRRVGIGRALLRKVATIAVRRKCARLEWSVLDWNKPAQRLYRKLGARPMSDWTIQRMTGPALLRLARGR
jgi:GNAT superfamily N-acetyltransferase